jgi:putative OPT family oligopeptide transporter
VAGGMFGGKDLPWGIIGIGAGVGAVIIAVDEWLKAHGKAFRVPVLAAAIGIYLPLELMVPIFLGGLLAYFVEKRHGIVGTHDESLRDRAHRPGVLFAAGLITGEALMGIAVGVAIYVTKEREVLALPAQFQQGEIVGLAVLAIVGWLLYRTGAKANPNAA